MWLSIQRICLPMHEMPETQIQSLVGKIPWRREWLPTPVFLPENPRDRGAWQAIQSMGLQRVGHDLVVISLTRRAQEFELNLPSRSSQLLTKKRDAQ